MDRIDCLRAFVRAMEGGSFSAAAKELGLGQPVVSKRIALLEQEFGSQLFMRTTRKLTPTREAHRVYELARQVLGTFEAARASISEAPARPPARCGSASVILRTALLDAGGARLHARLPEVKLDLRFDERTINLVEEGMELALRIGQLELSSLMARRIGTVRRIWLRRRRICASGHATDAGRSERRSMHRLCAARGQPVDLRVRRWPACRDHSPARRR